MKSTIALFKITLCVCVLLMWSCNKADLKEEPTSSDSVVKIAAGVTMQCYWIQNRSPYIWVDAPKYMKAKTKQDCYRLDSCNGGLGESGGGCYKWAKSANSPREPWKGELTDADMIEILSRQHYTGDEKLDAKSQFGYLLNKPYWIRSYMKILGQAYLNISVHKYRTLRDLTKDASSAYETLLAHKNQHNFDNVIRSIKTLYHDTYSLLTSLPNKVLLINSDKKSQMDLSYTPVVNQLKKMTADFKRSYDFVTKHYTLESFIKDEENKDYQYQTINVTRDLIKRLFLVVSKHDPNNGLDEYITHLSKDLVGHVESVFIQLDDAILDFQQQPDQSHYAKVIAYMEQFVNLLHGTSIVPAKPSQKNEAQQQNQDFQNLLQNVIHAVNSLPKTYGALVLNIVNPISEVCNQNNTKIFGHYGIDKTGNPYAVGTPLTIDLNGKQVLETASQSRVKRAVQLNRISTAMNLITQLSEIVADSWNSNTVHLSEDVVSDTESVFINLQDVISDFQQNPNQQTYAEVVQYMENFVHVLDGVSIVPANVNLPDQHNEAQQQNENFQNLLQSAVDAVNSLPSTYQQYCYPAGQGNNSQAYM